MSTIAVRGDNVDYTETAALAAEAFNRRDRVFDAKPCQGFYETALGHGFTIIALHDKGRKVGHIMTVRRAGTLDGATDTAAPPALASLSNARFQHGLEGPRIKEKPLMPLQFQAQAALCTTYGEHHGLA